MEKASCRSFCFLPGWWIVMTIAMPSRLFNDPYSTLLYSSDHMLLGARIAPDGQWHFPATDTLPGKFVTCLITFEDKRFFYHPGIDPAAVIRAFKQNFSSGRTVSGGSTLTMQLARISRGNRPRNWFEKLVEVNRALYLETRYRKKTILALYASHAPFGGGECGRYRNGCLAVFRA